ncbi:MAG: flavodoxin family protein [Nitrospinae bacterium]|nr:flavodoxin family protein [Nitrospinota bacterium]
MSKVTIVYHSGYGHTKLEAEAVYRGASGVKGVKADILTTEEATVRIDELDTADAIIFGCPTYMGNISADMKKFIEVASKKWFTQSWKDKIAGAFTTSSNFSGDKLNTLMGLVVNAMQHGMIFVGTGMFGSANDQEAMKTIEGPGPNTHNRVGSYMGPMGVTFQVDPPGSPSKGDIETAEAYGKRVAEITKQFVAGRSG